MRDSLDKKCAKFRKTGANLCHLLDVFKKVTREVEFLNAWRGSQPAAHGVMTASKHEKFSIEE